MRALLLVAYLAAGAGYCAAQPSFAATKFDLSADLPAEDPPPIAASQDIKPEQAPGRGVAAEKDLRN